MLVFYFYSPSPYFITDKYDTVFQFILYKIFNFNFILCYLILYYDRIMVYFRGFKIKQQIILYNYIDIAPMNQLPIVILSKELKYSLATEKIKTLQKAIEYLPKLIEQSSKLTQPEQNKRKTIENLAEKYNRIKANVANQFRKMLLSSEELLAASSTQQLPKLIIKSANPFYQFLLTRSISQVYGSKGSGKTSLLLHFAEQFGINCKQNKKDCKIYIFNCVSGITEKRISKLQKLKQQGVQVECLEISQVQQILKLVTKIKEQSEQTPNKKVFIGIDMMVLLLMTKQKPKSFLNKIFKIFAWLYQKYYYTVVFTNLVQHKFQLGNEQLYNHASYYCQSTTEYLTHKIYLQRPDKTTGGKFKLINIKNKKFQALFSIGVTGIQQIDSISPQ